MRIVVDIKWPNFECSRCGVEKSPEVTELRRDDPRHPEVWRVSGYMHPTGWKRLDWGQSEITICPQCFDSAMADLTRKAR